MILMIRASTGSKILWEDLPAILDPGSWIPARIKNDSKMIRMIQGRSHSKDLPNSVLLVYQRLNLVDLWGSTIYIYMYIYVERERERDRETERKREREKERK